MKKLALAIALLADPCRLSAPTDDSKKGVEVPDGLKALRHPEVRVRYQAAATLAKLGPQARFALEELRYALKDMDPFVRLKVAEAIWRIEPKSVEKLLPVIEKGLDDKNPQVRAAAAGVTSLLGDKAEPLLPALVKNLRHKDLTLRMETLEALGDLGATAKTTVKALLDLTQDDDFPLFEPLVGLTLGSLGKDVVRKLGRALEEKDAKRRRVAAYALAVLGMEAAPVQDLLIEALGDSEAAVRQSAAKALGLIGPGAKAALPSLEKLCRGKETNVRLAAALAHWQVSGKTENIAILIEGLKDESGLIRQGACEALALVGPAAKDAVPDLAKCLQEKDVRLRVDAAQALWRIARKADQVVPVLVKALKEDANLRLPVVKCLEDIGPAARAAFEPLLDLLQDQENDTLRRALVAALKKIDPQAAAKVGIR